VHVRGGPEKVRGLSDRVGAGSPVQSPPAASHDGRRANALTPEVSCTKNAPPRSGQGPVTLARSEGFELPAFRSVASGSTVAEGLMSC